MSKKTPLVKMTRVTLPAGAVFEVDGVPVVLMTKAVVSTAMPKTIRKLLHIKMQALVAQFSEMSAVAPSRAR